MKSPINIITFAIQETSAALLPIIGSSSPPPISQLFLLPLYLTNTALKGGVRNIIISKNIKHPIINHKKDHAKN